MSSSSLLFRSQKSGHRILICQLKQLLANSNKVTVLALVLLIFGYTKRMNSQAISPIPISPSKSLQVERLSTRTNTYPSIFKEDIFAPFQRNGFVLKNSDSRDIVAIYGIWTIEDFSGGIKTFDFMSDIYSSVSTSTVIPAGHDLIASPNGWIYPLLGDATNSQLSPHSVTFQRRIDAVTKAKNIIFVIDSIVYADGEIVGPNTRKIGLTIAARKTAAKNVSSKVRASISRGEDPTSILHGFTSALQGPDAAAQTKRDTEFYWEKLYATQLLSLQGDDTLKYEAILQYLEKLPEPVKFQSQPYTQQ